MVYHFRENLGKGQQELFPKDLVEKMDSFFKQTNPYLNLIICCLFYGKRPPRT